VAGLPCGVVASIVMSPQVSFQLTGQLAPHFHLLTRCVRGCHEDMHLVPRPIDLAVGGHGHQMQAGKVRGRQIKRLIDVPITPMYSLVSSILRRSEGVNIPKSAYYSLLADFGERPTQSSPAPWQQMCKDRGLLA
jgi:hypothetical protein